MSFFYALLELRGNGLGKFTDALAKLEKNKTSKNGDAVTLLGADADLLNDDAAHSTKIDEKIVSYYMPQTFDAEQFRLLKTGLLFSKNNKVPRTIMVTSAEPDDGKSFIAANLAITFAKSVDSHVVLMDCDLRNSTIHKLFGLPDNGKGLSDWLNENINLKEMLNKTHIDKLTIIPGGKHPNNPTELLSSARMLKLLDELKSRYDDRYIIIDSPPPLLTAEAIAISRLVDGVVIVVRHEKTSRNTLKKMIEVLDKEKILGVILNRYDVRADKYYGHGKYGKYYNSKS